jgi:putative membrane protein
MKLTTLIVTFSFAAAGVACGEEKKPDNLPAVEKAPAKDPAAARPAGSLSDAQIAAIVVVANQIDVDAGVLATKKATHPEVKKLAERMVTDHTGVNKAAGELVTKLGVEPEETDASRGLAAGGDAKHEELDGLEGAAFDKAYVDNEVAYHEAVIGVLDAQLIPSATNAELKTMLVDVRPAFVAHLEHARQVQAALAGQASAGHAGAH